MSDLSTLKDMGFDAERATLALKAGGNLNGAIDYLERNADKSLEELKEEAEIDAGPAIDAAKVEEGATAKSWKCNECEKKFRSYREMQFHANKSGHTDMAESTEELPPLTAEEKAAKLVEMRSKLNEKRAAQAAQDKEDKKKNDAIRRLATKETQDMKEQLENKERIKEAEKKRREKKADIAARQKVLDQIAADKAERKRKADLEKAAREGRAVPAEAAAPAPKPSAPKAAAAYTETRLRLQTPSGNLMKSFPVETTLFEVAEAVKTEQGIEVSSFATNFPKKTFETEDFGMTLKEAGMVPSAAVIVR
jgi:hypothetical protein